MESWKDSNEKYNKVIDSKINYVKNLKIVKIWDDHGGTELGVDIDSRKVFCFDHDYGLISNSISISKLLKLKG